MGFSYNIDMWIFVIALLVLLGVLTSDISTRLKIPAPLLFLIIGMLAGSDGIGGVHFNNVLMAQYIGIIALIFCLFSGGLGTKWHLIRPIFWSGLILSTIGVLLSSLLVAIFAYLLLGFSFLEGFLLGAIVSATDAAAIFSIFRSRHFMIKQELRMLVEFESGTNDPIAILLVFMILNIMQDPDFTALSLSLMFMAQVGGGITIGYIMAKMANFLFQRLELEYASLYPVLSISLALLTYGLAAAIGGSGFLATYLMGMIFQTQNSKNIDNIKEFHDALSWLFEISMFVILGLLVFPTQLHEVLDCDLALPFFLIFIARPLSVFASLAFSHFSNKEKMLVSWLGLRGAVPIVLATFPMVMGIPKSHSIFNIVFFTVLASFMIQGGFAPRFIKWLKLD